MISFSSSLEALDFFKRNGADLVITDFQMPIFNGLQLTAAIRSIDVAVPILVISGNDLGREAAASGANAFLPKTALLTELGPTLERLGVCTTPSGLGWMT